MRRRLISEAMVRQAAREGRPIELDEDSLLTPSAKDAIRQLGVPLKEKGLPQQHLPAVPSFRTVGVICDHGAVGAKKWVCEALEHHGVEYRDHGVEDAAQSCDYPDQAALIARKVQDGTYWRGIILDGAGIGSAITANKFRGVRAGMVYDALTATNARAHNNVNIITLGGQLLGEKTIKEIVRIFLFTDFDGGRHQRRIDKIQQIDDEERR